jgi:hypothetical protein
MRQLAQLLVLLVLLLGNRQAEATITLLARTSIQSNSSSPVTTVTRPLNTTGATLLVLSLSVSTAAAPRNVSDSFGNTWVQIVQKTQGNVNITLYYVKNPTVGAGHTFTSTGTPFNAASFVVHAFAGTDTTANVDQFNSASAAALAGGVIQPGSVTPTANNELVLTAAACGASKAQNNDAITGGFIQTDALPFVSSHATDLSTAYLIQTTAAATNPTWTLSAVANPCAPAAVIATFKADPANPTPPTPPPPNVMFISGFEMGYPPINTGAGADSDGDTSTVQGGATFSSVAGTALGGAWAMNEANVGAGTETSMFQSHRYSTPTLSCRFYLKIAAENTTFQSVPNVYQLTATGFVKQLEIGLDSNRRFLTTALGGFGVVNGTTQLNSDQWYRLDVIYNAVDGGVAQLYLDGVLELNTTHTGTKSNLIVMRVHGIQGGTPVGNLRFDDFLCTDGLERPPDGRSIVRQGIIGTPIDNAWTLTSCSGAIETCWSHTPYNQNAAAATSGSITTSSAQTMKIAPFSAVQTGHGTEVLINGSTTVNAVQIAFVGKTSSVSNSGNNISIRRYVNGTLIADYPITLLSTGDTFQKSPIFTDTIPNLDLYEVGVVKPVTGAALSQTVRAVWVLVDCNGPGCVPLSLRRQVYQE